MRFSLRKIFPCIFSQQSQAKADDHSRRTLIPNEDGMASATTSFASTSSIDVDNFAKKENLGVKSISVSDGNNKSFPLPAEKYGSVRSSSKVLGDTHKCVEVCVTSTGKSICVADAQTAVEPPFSSLNHSAEVSHNHEQYFLNNEPKCCLGANTTEDSIILLMNVTIAEDRNHSCHSSSDVNVSENIESRPVTENNLGNSSMQIDGEIQQQDKYDMFSNNKIEETKYDGDLFPHRFPLLERRQVKSIRHIESTPAITPSDPRYRSRLDENRAITPLAISFEEHVENEIKRYNEKKSLSIHFDSEDIEGKKQC